MRLNTVLFLSLLFTALALGASMAHLLELPHKIALSGPDYLTVQQIYRGWSLLGFIVFGALASNLATAIAVRTDLRLFLPALLALLAVVASQIVFWAYTFPVNQATQNWTVLPANWLDLRYRWEYSHAAGALLNLVAFIFLVRLALSRAR